jgi:two-component system cell cycle response regulator
MTAGSAASQRPHARIRLPQRVARPGWTRHPRAWLAYPAGAALVTGGYFLIPPTATGARTAVYFLVSLSAAAAIVVGIRLRRPVPRTPWVLLAIGQTVYAAADATFYVTRDLLGVTAFPGPSDVLYLAHYPLLVTGLLLLVRLRAPGRGLAGLLDAATVAVAASMLSWLFLLGPQATASEPLLQRIVCAAYPAADLAVLAVALRLVLERGRRPASFALICVSLLAILAANSVYVWQMIHGTYATGNGLELAWLTGHIALGTAALHPTMRQLSEPAPRPAAATPGRGRIAMLATAALVAPAALLVHAVDDPDGQDADAVVIAVACAAMFTLTILRMAGLVGDQRRLAATDALTGLSTRRFLEARLTAELARAKRGGGTLSLFLVDVDHFKLVNDRYGHPAGDRVLTGIADRLRRAAPDGGLVARFGGEEFALLVPNGRPDALAVTAERLRQAIAAAPVALGPEAWTSVTVSVGAAAYPEHAEAAVELVGVADTALYAAKARGRDRAVIGSAPHARSSVVDGASRMLDYLAFVADDVDGRLSGHEHSSAVGRWARRTALELGLDADTVRRVELAGRLHDVGKIVVPDAVLTKPEPLTRDEWAMMAQHAEHGFRMTLAVPGLATVAETIRQHHERYDGTGYPEGLAGDAIRLEARIIAVCDSWAAMRADRLYQRSLPEEQAREELLRCRGTQFDPAIVDLFLDLLYAGAVGDLRRLRAGPVPPPSGAPHEAAPAVARR